ncbi:MAG: ATP-dependent protease ATPase subunit HslU [Candidatus Bipolaricaulota bacterium]|nr:ATP-dependent protease ATPase subunit HslU [Candidatus Bipolaricaulota bacterium]
MSALMEAPDDQISGLTPQQVVDELDKYIVGQTNAKRAVAIALRNRLRCQYVDEEMRFEIKPKNILMIGPTGVGKTEISRRLARLTTCPFVKVEATKFTEVGYVGRDVETMVRDLVDTAIDMIREDEIVRVEDEAERMVIEEILDALLPPATATDEEAGKEKEESAARTREKLREKLVAEELEERYIEITVEEPVMPQIEVFSQDGMDQMGIDMGDVLSGLLPPSRKKKKIRIREARNVLFEQVVDRLVNMDEVRQEGLRLAEEMGIIFIDEIDKIAAGGREELGGPGVSRQGVQRDLLPFLEGTTVRTRYGAVSTENILFIAAGAFNMSKPSDLIPELQGRLPIRVELDSLTASEFRRILTEPKDALIAQYKALLATEGLSVEFDPKAIDAIASIAYELNQTTENIGARRLTTVMEKLMEEISFDADRKRGETVRIDKAYVDGRLAGIATDPNLSRYIL